MILIFLSYGGATKQNSSCTAATTNMARSRRSKHSLHPYPVTTTLLLWKEPTTSSPANSINSTVQSIHGSPTMFFGSAIRARALLSRTVLSVIPVPCAISVVESRSSSCAFTAREEFAEIFRRGRWHAYKPRVGSHVLHVRHSYQRRRDSRR